MKNVGAIIQTRTSSTRLPGKVLKELSYPSDITCLKLVIRRLKKSKKINDIVVATTEEKEDNKLINIVKKDLAIILGIFQKQKTIIPGQ